MRRAPNPFPYATAGRDVNTRRYAAARRFVRLIKLTIGIVKWVFGPHGRQWLATSQAEKLAQQLDRDGFILGHTLAEDDWRALRALKHAGVVDYNPDIEDEGGAPFWYPCREQLAGYLAERGCTRQEA